MQQMLIYGITSAECCIEREFLPLAAPLFRMVLSRIIDYDSAKLLGGYSKKVSSIPARQCFGGEQLYVQFMHQRCWLQRVVLSFRLEIVSGEPAKITVYTFDNFVTGAA